MFSSGIECADLTVNCMSLTTGRRIFSVDSDEVIEELTYLLFDRRIISDSGYGVIYCNINNHTTNILKFIILRIGTHGSNDDEFSCNLNLLISMLIL